MSWSPEINQGKKKNDDLWLESFTNILLFERMA